MTMPGEILFKDIPEPGKLQPNEVLLKIQRIGVCGSDIHVYHGKHPFTPFPVVQGHEYSGKVVATGSDVVKVSVGMLATARPQLVCGECGPCKRGQYNVCSKLRVEGFQAPGCASEYFVVPEERVIGLPDTLSSDQGALVEPASVGAHATKIVGDIKGKNVVVSGAGTIGNLVAQFAVIRGAAKVLITDFSAFRLQKALDCGVHFSANLREETFEDAIIRCFGDDGFQVGFEAVGVQNALDSLVNNVEKGGVIGIIGVYEENPRINMGFVCEHELTINGSMMYRHEDYEETVQVIASGKLKTEPLITGYFPFGEYLDAYKYIDREGERTLKTMITL